jgi:hypothetical protein
MDPYKGLQDVSHYIHTKFKPVMNLKKLIKRKGCVTADGSDNVYEMVENVLFFL